MYKKYIMMNDSQIGFVSERERGARFLIKIVIFLDMR